MNIRKIAGFAVVVIVLVVAGYALADEESSRTMEAARKALNNAEYKKAAELMSEVYRQQKDTVEAGNALYWEAFARYRLQRDVERKKAVELLRLQQQEYELSETAHEGAALLARLYAEMAERGGIEAITQIERMSDEEAQQEEARIQALHALMRMNPEKAVPILEKIVMDESKGTPELRRNALFILCREDDERSVDLLLKLAKTTTDEEMLSEVVMCLSMKDSDRALDAIVAVLDQTESAEVADGAMLALGRHGGERAFSILADIATNPAKDVEVRSQAMFGLSRIGRDDEVAGLAVNLLQNAEEPEILEAALFMLSRLDSKVPDRVFLDLINNPSANDEMRAQALFFAAQRSDLSLDFLMGTYQQASDRDLKLQVCHVISQMDDSDKALDALIGIARTETDPEIRLNMLHWIGQYDNDKAAEYLLEVINQE